LPSHKIYEDNYFIAILDIFPRVKGHTLLIPKQHYRYVYDVPNFGKYWETAKTVGLKIQQALNSNFLTFLTIGNEVPHAHIHILPQATENPEGFSLGEGISMSQSDLEHVVKDIVGQK